MKCKARLAIPSMTFDAKDLKILIQTAEKSLNKLSRKAVSTSIKLKGSNYEEEFDTIPDIDSFGDGLQFLEIEIKSPNDLEISITLSTLERNPFSPVFSEVLVEGNDSTLVAGVLDEIKRFFSKRRNWNWLFHSWGIPIAITLSWLITFILYFDLRNISIMSRISKEIWIIFGLILSHPLKAFLRWSFPYFQFRGENRYREYIRFALGAIILGVLGNAVYAFITGGFSLFPKPE